MEFARPWLLLLTVLALPVLALATLRGREALVLPASGRLGALRPTFRLRAQRALPLLRATAIILMAVAVAGPRIGHANAVVPAEGIDIALSLDISSSMTQTLGSKKTRLEAAKDVVREFIRGRENDRVGLVVFQKTALALAPPTLDYRALDAIVKDLETGLLPDGTGIGLGLGEALNMLRDSTAATRTVILLTDGQQNESSLSPRDAADLAAALKIRVYTIGVVSRIEPGVPSGEVDEKLLRDIAESTGGQYFAADSPESLRDVYAEIGKLEKSGVGRERFNRFTELAPWFAIPAAALVVLELLLRATWLRRTPS